MVNRYSGSCSYSNEVNVTGGIVKRHSDQLRKRVFDDAGLEAPKTVPPQVVTPEEGEPRLRTFEQPTVIEDSRANEVQTPPEELSATAHTNETTVPVTEGDTSAPNVSPPAIRRSGRVRQTPKHLDDYVKKLKVVWKRIK